LKVNRNPISSSYLGILFVVLLFSLGCLNLSSDGPSPIEKIQATPTFISAPIEKVQQAKSVIKPHLTPIPSAIVKNESSQTKNIQKEINDSDSYFGVIVHNISKPSIRYFLTELGVKWFIDFKPNSSNVPTGFNKVPHFSINQASPMANRLEIQRIVKSAPQGSYWYIGGEPNTLPTNISGKEFAEIFKYYYSNIKAIDSTAKIMSPSILNWWFECTNCGGYITGREWVDQFRYTYKESYGIEPPVDVWAIDLYPLDWGNVPTVNADLVIGQLAGGRLPCNGGKPYLEGQRKYSDADLFDTETECLAQQPIKEGLRSYLDAIPEYRNTPIWITEIALHWGYEGWSFSSPFDQDKPIVPVGRYCEREVANYMINIFDWLKNNANEYKIERWFQFLTYADIEKINITGYAGITLFDAPEIGASLTSMGKIYRDLINDTEISIDLSKLQACP